MSGPPVTYELVVTLAPSEHNACPSRLQYHAVGEHTLDLDIQNCCPTLLQQLLKKMDPKPTMPQKLHDALDRLVYHRQALFKELNMAYEEGKKKANETLRSLRQISIYVRWVACIFSTVNTWAYEAARPRPFHQRP